MSKKGAAADFEYKFESDEETLDRWKSLIEQKFPKEQRFPLGEKPSLSMEQEPEDFLENLQFSFSRERMSKMGAESDDTNTGFKSGDDQLGSWGSFINSQDKLPEKQRVSSEEKQSFSRKQGSEDFDRNIQGSHFFTRVKVSKKVRKSKKERACIMSKTDALVDDEEIDWGYGFKSGYELLGAWESFIESQDKLPEEQRLSSAEQIELGVRVCLKKYNPNEDLSETIRNPEDPTRYIIEQPFRRAFRSAAKEIYDLMIYTSEISTKKDEIVKIVFSRFPPEVLQGLAHFYKKHIKDGQKMSDQVARKEEFMRIVMFQFVLSAIQEHANDDIQNLVKVNRTFSTLYKPGVGKPGAFDGIIEILDESLTHIQPLGEMSENLSKKVNTSRQAAYGRIPKLKIKRNLIKNRMEEILDEIKDDNKKRFGEEKARDIENNNEDIQRIRALTSKAANCYNPETLDKYSKEIATIYQKISSKSVESSTFAEVETTSLSSKEKNQEFQAESTSQESQSETTSKISQSEPSPDGTSAVSTPKTQTASPPRSSVTLPPLPFDEFEEGIPSHGSSSHVSDNPQPIPAGRFARAWTALTSDKITPRKIGKAIKILFSRKGAQEVQPVAQTLPSAVTISPTVSVSTLASSHTPRRRVLPTVSASTLASSHTPRQRVSPTLKQTERSTKVSATGSACAPSQVSGHPPIPSRSPMSSKSKNDSSTARSTAVSSTGSACAPSTKVSRQPPIPSRSPMSSKSRADSTTAKSTPLPSIPVFEFQPISPEESSDETLMVPQPMFTKKYRQEKQPKASSLRSRKSQTDSPTAKSTPLPPIPVLDLSRLSLNESSEEIFTAPRPVFTKEYQKEKQDKKTSSQTVKQSPTRNIKQQRKSSKRKKH